MIAINTAALEYDENERTNSQMHEQTTPGDHTDSIKRELSWQRVGPRQRLF